MRLWFEFVVEEERRRQTYWWLTWVEHETDRARSRGCIYLDVDVITYTADSTRLSSLISLLLASPPSVRKQSREADIDINKDERMELYLKAKRLHATHSNSIPIGECIFLSPHQFFLAFRLWIIFEAPLIGKNISVKIYSRARAFWERYLNKMSWSWKIIELKGIRMNMKKLKKKKKWKWRLVKCPDEYCSCLCIRAFKSLQALSHL